MNHDFSISSTVRTDDTAKTQTIREKLQIFVNETIALLDQDDAVIVLSLSSQTNDNPV